MDNNNGSYPQRKRARPGEYHHSQPSPGGQQNSSQGNISQLVQHHQTSVDIETSNRWHSRHRESECSRGRQICYSQQHTQRHSNKLNHYRKRPRLSQSDESAIVPAAYQDFSLAKLADKCNKYSKGLMGNVKKETLEFCQVAAQYIQKLDLSNQAFQPGDLSLLANAFSKQPDKRDCKGAIVQIAQLLGGQTLIQTPDYFNKQDLSNLANVFSKQPDNHDCKRAIVQIAQSLRGKILRQALRHFDAQTLAMLANAFSKQPDKRDCKRAIVQIAQLLSGETLDQALHYFDAQALAKLANAFSKQPDKHDCKHAIVQIAQLLSGKTLGQAPYHFNLQELAKLANAFSKEPEEPLCDKALQKIALYLEKSQLQESNLLDITQLLKVFTPVKKTYPTLITLLSEIEDNLALVKDLDQILDEIAAAYLTQEDTNNSDCCNSFPAPSTGNGQSLKTVAQAMSARLDQPEKGHKSLSPQRETDSFNQPLINAI